MAKRPLLADDGGDRRRDEQRHRTGGEEVPGVGKVEALLEVEGEARAGVVGGDRGAELGGGEDDVVVDELDGLAGGEGDAVDRAGRYPGREAEDVSLPAHHEVADRDIPARGDAREARQGGEGLDDEVGVGGEGLHLLGEGVLSAVALGVANEQQADAAREEECDRDEREEREGDADSHRSAAAGELAQSHR